MKKFFSIFVAALFCTTLGAQTLSEGFEGENFPPEGWSVIDGYAGYGWKKGVKLSHNCAMIQEVSGTENWLITPQLKPAAGEKLTFSACVGDYASSGELRIEVSLSGTDAGSFEMLTSYSTSSKAENHLWKTEWREYTIDLSAYKGAAIYIGFHQVGETDRIFLDDVKGVSLKGTSSCENPTDISITDLSANSVSFAWSGEAAEYQYVLVEAGEEADWSKAAKIAEKNVTISGLYEETDYVFFVRSYCSESEQSLAPKVAFKTPCASFNVPWIETFTRDLTGDVAPDCWTVAEGCTQVWVVKDKTYDDEGNVSTVNGQAHLYAAGGGPKTEQVFSMPTFNAPLNTLEVAFDYKTNLVNESYGKLEIGYMTNPNKASTFVSLQTLPQTLNYVHKVITLEDLPATAKFISFRFAGGTSDFSGASMDNFVVAEIGKSGEVDPGQEIIPDAGIWALTYCEASFVWFSYTAEAFAIGVFEDANKTLIAGTVATTGECDRFAQQDGVGFSEDEDYENKYYCSTKWILNVDEEGLQKGDAWDSHVINIGSSVSPQLGLKSGKYVVQVYALVQNGESYSKGELLANIPFELVEKKVANLAAVVAEDKQTATLTWEAPEFGQGERLYVRVWSGETVAYDNFDTKERPESPFTVNVVEGLAYTAIVQVIDKNKNPLGSEAEVNFTVGVNSFEPKNPTATVAGGDNVTFTWDADVLADRYLITLYCNGEFYGTLNVDGNSKTTTMPKDGTWTWTVQAFNQGANGNYFEASNAIEGNSFVTKAAEIPEDAIELDIIGLNAFYIEPGTQWYQEGKNGWVLQFGLENSGYNFAWFLVYTHSAYALSGVYNLTRGNLDDESDLIYLTDQSMIQGTESEVRLSFDGYDEEEVTSTYSVTQAYYTGSFRLVGEDGKTYIGRFMELKCSSGDFTSYMSGNASYHITLYDEDPSYFGFEGIQNNQLPITNHKYIKDGQLFIIRDGKTYNAQGALVK